MAHSAIVIPVPALEPMIRPRMRRALPDYVFADPESVHAHITVLGPFVSAGLVDDALLERLRGIFATTEPFAFSFAGTRHTFDDGTVHLKPDPAEPFGALTSTLWQAFPDYPPYGDPIKPPLAHLTLDYPWAPRSGDGDDPEPAFPVRCTAETACLNWYEPGKSRTMASFALGGDEGTALPMTDDTLDPGFEQILRRTVPLLGDGHLAPETDLLAAGLDSMAAVQLLAEIEGTYEVIIPDEALLGDIFATPRDLWDLVRKYRGGE